MTGHAGIAGQGPYYVVDLTIDADGVIRRVATDQMGCMWSGVVAMAAAALVENRPMATASISPAEILAKTGALPRSKEDLPGLVCAALHDAQMAWRGSAAGVSHRQSLQSESTTPVLAD